MSDILGRNVMKQDAVLWVKTGTNSSGQPIYAAPVQIVGPNGEKVRWTRMDQEIRDDKGVVIASNAIVMVPYDVEVGDVMMLGLLAAVLPGKAPVQNPGAYMVRRMRKIPNRKANKFLRKALL